MEGELPTGPVAVEDLPEEIQALFCEACGRDVTDVLDEDFFVPQEGAEAKGYLSGRCVRHPPEEADLFGVVHIGGVPDEEEA